ncbi:MAG TPA: PD-(D/E)XK nuclease family protein [Candidatus Acidoferrales bacterium]|nr:PD-(D/E)XK nuclease family protein [Candidatus Acidoferrales bacterium]
MNRRLIDFVCTAARYAASPDDATAARLLDMPYSGVPRADGRAVVVAAAGRAVPEALGRNLVPLARESALAAQRFARGLETLASSYRAQGISAADFARSVIAAFDLSERFDEQERATQDAIEARAAEIEAAWEAATLVRTLEQLADEAAPATARAEIVPLRRREPEAPLPVPRRRTHFSASSLGMFAECERRWYYRYVCAAVEDKGSSASFYGTAFHWALEQFHVEAPRAGSATEAELERRLAGWINTAFERFRIGFETNVEYELQRRRAQRTAVRYLRWFVERSRTQPFTVIGTEAEAALELEGYRFIGYIDRLDREDATGNVTVVDYKTGAIAASAREHREKIAQLIDFQLPFYYWVRTAQGDRVTRLVLLPLKDASLDVRPIELEVVPVAVPSSSSDAPVGTIGIDELVRARAKMIELARSLSDDPIEHFAVTDDPEACTWCAYRLACRSRPLRAAERFAR